MVVQPDAESDGPMSFMYKILVFNNLTVSMAIRLRRDRQRPFPLVPKTPSHAHCGGKRRPNFSKLWNVLEQFIRLFESYDGG
jgi:hypothetical protein